MQATCPGSFYGEHAIALEIPEELVRRYEQGDPFESLDRVEFSAGPRHRSDSVGRTEIASRVGASTHRQRGGVPVSCELGPFGAKTGPRLRSQSDPIWLYA